MARSERVHGIKKVRSHRALISFTYCTLHAWRSLAALPCDFKMSLELGVFGARMSCFAPQTFDYST